MKRVFLCALLLAGMVLAAPKTYTVLSTDTPPTIDGSVSDWSQVNLLDSLDSDDNCFYRTDGQSWNSSLFQMKLYSTCDADWVYFAAVVTVDPSLVLTSSVPWNRDNIKINPGDRNQVVMLAIDNICWYNTAFPYDTNTANATFLWGINPTGNNTLPTYEFAISRIMLDPWESNAFKYAIGTEDITTAGVSRFLAVGVEYTGSKTAADNQWDVSDYYPTFQLTTSDAEVGVKRLTQAALSAYPNPVTTSTMIHCNLAQNGTIKLYNLKGELVNRFTVHAGQSSVAWNGTDLAGQRVASGIYVMSLAEGKNIHRASLFVTK